ncbi:MAG: YdiU family protein [Gammaproteobacteria bacterium]|nr:YdiU family protein [Gammaproteobacteria bacterium]
MILAQPDAIEAQLAALRFDNRFAGELPADPERANFRRQVAGACYSFAKPTPARRPKLIGWSPEAATLLDLPADPGDGESLAEVFAGNRLLPGMLPVATCYGGHQFGHWAGQLGDGRAINLGEIVNTRGERWTLQLKGAGPTPYSRTADGLAVLRSSLREFLCSEAMFHLGVPTTRALSLVLTGEEVVRDMLYDGHPAPEPGAVVCRVAPSFTRFGHFEILAARHDVELMRQLLDFTIATDFPHIGDADQKTRYLEWFDEVTARTADMIAHWMRVGFVHGVMNTDNMSVLGLTIDYGPYGWLEDYDPNWTPNTTDASTRRYRFGQQPAVAQWNLLQLANAICPLIGEADPLNEVLGGFAKRYAEAARSMTAAKLGLARFIPEHDEALCDELFALLGAVETDMTLFFRNLASVDPGDPSAGPLEEAYYQPAQRNAAYRERLAAWLSDYGRRVQLDGRPNEVRVGRMNAVNPRFVLRNYLAQLAIDKAEAGDYSMIGELLAVLRDPYADQPGQETFAGKRPDWARHRPGCSMLSCSS